ncbi:MAG: DUF4144 domain-containing protein [Gammaproteobacteria bacterium]|nr:DUF4144 domain-containing protein [Gammaproteobacteria bacterium]
MNKALQQQISMIHWPAVIIFEGDGELCYIDCEQAWIQDAESLFYNHHGNDRLIDSSGRIYDLEHRTDDQIVMVDSGERIRLTDFVKLVRIHASCSHRCCIEKINFRSIAEGVRLIDSMNQV